MSGIGQICRLQRTPVHWKAHLAGPNGSVGGSVGGSVSNQYTVEDGGIPGGILCVFLSRSPRKLVLALGLMIRRDLNLVLPCPSSMCSQLYLSRPLTHKVKCCIINGSWAPMICESRTILKVLATVYNIAKKRTVCQQWLLWKLISWIIHWLLSKGKYIINNWGKLCKIKWLIKSG